MPKNIRSDQVLTDAMQFHKSGNVERAIPLYRRYLKYKPQSAQALHYFGIAQSQVGNYEYSISLISKAIEIQKRIKLFDLDFINMNNNLGNALRSAGKYEASLKAYHNALQWQPSNALVLNNVGISYKCIGETLLSKQHFKLAIANEPLYVEAIINMGNLCRETGLIQEAIIYYKKAMGIDRNNAVTRCNFALALLSIGDFKQGWELYESRWQGNQWPLRPYNFPVWSGESLVGKSILVYAEQGIGDEVMFVSCLPDLVKLGATVIVECDPRLEGLYRRSFTSVHAIGRHRDHKSLDWLKDFPEIEKQIPVGSLPALLRPDLGAFPHHCGYLIADHDAVMKWKSRNADFGNDIKVGISWRGGRSDYDKSIRSISLEHWLPILKIQGVTFINLQYGEISDELEMIEKKYAVEIHDWDDSDPLSDFDDFAAQIRALDLVISIDNSTVHLAGGLGVETWVLQAIGGDWRWLHNEVDSYWYPGISNYWQTSPYEWDNVIGCVADRLKKRMSNFNQ